MFVGFYGILWFRCLAFGLWLCWVFAGLLSACSRVVGWVGLFALPGLLFFDLGICYVVLFSMLDFGFARL